jgi:hypothetical protein
MPAMALLQQRRVDQCVVYPGGWAAAEGQAEEGQGRGQGWQRRSGWQEVLQGRGCGEQQWRGEPVAWGGQPPLHDAIRQR